jgi:hypothetical protein
MELAITSLLIAGLSGYLIYRVRKFKDHVTSARELLKQNAQSFETYSVEEYLTACQISDSHKQTARKLLTYLAGILDVAPEKIAVERSMEELFSITEIDSETGDESRFEPVTYQIYETVASWSDKQLWDQKWSELPKQPHNESEWADLIMSMTTSEFLRFFSPLIKHEQG